MSLYIKIELHPPCTNPSYRELSLHISGNIYFDEAIGIEEFLFIWREDDVAVHVQIFVRVETFHFLRLFSQMFRNPGGIRHQEGLDDLDGGDTQVLKKTVIMITVKSLI